MKINKSNVTLLLSTLALMSFTNPKIYAAAQNYDGRAYDNRIQMDFTDSTDEEIKQYYDYDNMIKLEGEPLKEYLHQITKKDNFFLTYDGGYASTGKTVGKWYRITDRNWTLSNSITENSYKFSSEASSPDDVRLVNLYFEESANNDRNKATNNSLNSFKVLSGATKVDYTNKTKPSNVGTDKEHVWAKNHGFKVKGSNGDTFCDGAPTDLHHLIAADAKTNQNAHNDYFYGEVPDKSKATVDKCYYGDGTTAVSGWTDTSQTNFEIYEPTDEWKGDIARCLLYMATRYGHKNTSSEGPQSQGEPYLTFSDDDIDDNQNFIGRHPKSFLETYLKWNKNDPVSDYERHRNNLIYKNVQRNRNPYIDYPFLADLVFGEGIQSDLSRVLDSYTLKMSESISLDYTLSKKDNVSLTSDNPSILEISNNRDLKAISQGSCNLTLTITKKDQTTLSKTFKVTVIDMPTTSGVNTSDFSKLDKEYFLHVSDEVNFDINLVRGTNKDEIQINYPSEFLQKINDTKFKAIKKTSQPINVTYNVKDINKKETSHTTTIKINDVVSLVNQDENIDNLDLDSGSELQLSYSLNNQFNEFEKIYYESSDESILKVDENGKITTFDKDGEVILTIGVKNTTSQKKKVLKTIKVNVKKKSIFDNKVILYIFIGVGVILVLGIIILFLCLLFRKKKKI